jgi:hypothetical protein
MNRKRKIAVASTLSSLALVGAPVSAFSSSPLLSGYGGPGAGEQAIIGSTLSGGPSGGGPSGSSGSLGHVSASQSGPGAAAGGGIAGSTATGGIQAVGSAGGPSPSRGHGGGAPHAAGLTSTRAGAASVGAKQTEAFVYPSSLRPASNSSPALGISGGDLLVLLAVLTTLGLVGTLTLRLSRLQRQL